MARGKSGTGAKRGPKPKATHEDVVSLEKKLDSGLRRLTKLVRAIHAEVVPGSTEGTPEPEPAEETGAPAADPALSVGAGESAKVEPAALPVEAEIVEIDTPTPVTAPAQTSAASAKV